MANPSNGGTASVWQAELGEAPAGEAGDEQFDLVQSAQLSDVPPPDGDGIWLEPAVAGTDDADLQGLLPLDSDSLLEGVDSIPRRSQGAADFPEFGLGSGPRGVVELHAFEQRLASDFDAGFERPGLVSDGSRVPQPGAFGESLGGSTLGQHLMGAEHTAPNDAMSADVLAIIDALPTSWPLGSPTSSASPLPSEAVRATAASAFAPATGMLMGAAAAEAATLLTPIDFGAEPATGDAFLDQMASIANATAFELSEADGDLEANAALVVRAEQPLDEPDPELLFDELIVGEDDQGTAGRLGAIASGAPTGAISSSTPVDGGAAPILRADTNEAPSAPTLDRGVAEENAAEPSDATADVNAVAPVETVPPILDEEVVDAATSPEEVVAPESPSTPVDTEVPGDAADDPTTPRDDDETPDQTELLNHISTDEVVEVGGLDVEPHFVGIDYAGDGLPDGLGVGDIVNYELRITNETEQTVHDVRVFDPRTGTLLTTIPSLSPEATESVPASFAITEDDLDALVSLVEQADAFTLQSDDLLSTELGASDSIAGAADEAETVALEPPVDATTDDADAELPAAAAAEAPTAWEPEPQAEEPSAIGDGAPTTSVGDTDADGSAIDGDGDGTDLASSDGASQSEMIADDAGAEDPASVPTASAPADAEAGEEGSRGLGEGGGVAYPPAGMGVPAELAAKLLDLLSPIDGTRLDSLERAVLDEPAAEPVDAPEEEEVAAAAAPKTEEAPASGGVDVPDVAEDTEDSFDTNNEGGLS